MGENSIIFFKVLLMTSLMESSNNFKLINDEVSNYKIMQNANRLVTYWGTCHIESAVLV